MSAKYPLIFIFSGKSGKLHGYKDESDGVRHFYFGEGQIGDMEFTRGNRALWEHKKSGRKVYLLKDIGKGFAEFVDEVQVEDFHYERGLDTLHNERQAIVFELLPIKPREISIAVALSDENIPPPVTERSGLVTSRIGQGKYRRDVVKRWNGACAVTKCAQTEILIASHIHPWQYASPYERLDVENGLLLSPNVDALFDKHLITFDKGGSIVISDRLHSIDITLLGIHNGLKIHGLTNRNTQYLEMHNERFFANS